VRHRAAEGTRLDAVDREVTEVERMRGVRYQIPLNMGNSRTRDKPVTSLGQELSLTTAMVTRSRKFCASALDPSAS
jgi:hypothetical protein